MASRPGEVLSFIGRSSRRIAISVVGAVFVCGGLALLLLPGPGLLVIAVGFAILGTEYAWAAMVLERTKVVAGRAQGVFRTVGRRIIGR